MREENIVEIWKMRRQFGWFADQPETQPPTRSEELQRARREKVCNRKIG